MSGGINPPKKIKKKGHGAAVFMIEITQFEDGYVELRGGIPTSFDVAIGMLFAGIRVVCNMFLRCAKENKLNDQNVIDGSRIVTVKPGASLH